MIDFTITNALLKQNLQSLSREDKDYWSFKGKSARGYGHGLFQYPAMMVPQVTKAIINNIVAVHPEIKTVYDPFVGSGTVMTESMIRGFSFLGTDINPLAILLCQVKRGPFFINRLKEKSEMLMDRIKADKNTNYEVTFTNKSKWFIKSSLIWLSKIRRSIQAEESIWARKFFWIVLAETIRLTSNSRTSTFKLHIRTKEDINERRNSINVFNVFHKILDHNLREYEDLYSKLNKNNLLQDGYYVQDIQLAFSDVKKAKNPSKADLIITSPPYGDNTTTVPYGQHSYLPLQWIDFSDIDIGIDKATLLKTTNEIDYRSLGGSKKITKEVRQQLVQRSENLSGFLKCLHAEPQDKTDKVIAFFRDLDQCIDPILQNLNNQGIMVWVLGNRRVCGKQVPLDKILSDLFKKRNVNIFCELARKIPSKRMATKNNITDTMSDEIILLMRKEE